MRNVQVMFRFGANFSGEKAFATAAPKALDSGIWDYGDRCGNPQTHPAIRAINASAAFGSASTIPSSVRAGASGAPGEPASLSRERLAGK